MVIFWRDKNHLQRYWMLQDAFFRGISIQSLDWENEAQAYKTGCSGLNWLYMTHNPMHTKRLEEILKQGSDFFVQADGFEIIVAQNLLTPEKSNILHALGYLVLEKRVAMVLDLLAYKSHIGTVSNVQDTTFEMMDSTIRIRSNDVDLHQWVIPLIGAFQSTFLECEKYAQAHLRALKKGIHLHHFSLYNAEESQEKPVASVTLSLSKNGARIDDLGTLPEFQGQGYGTALMHHALYKAKQWGAQLCFLEASVSGLNLYQKLGFLPLFENQVYSLAA